MLIDFSDALQVNVYTLGTCFLKFRRMLSLSLEIVGKCILVYLQINVNTNMDVPVNIQF